MAASSEEGASAFVGMTITTDEASPASSAPATVDSPLNRRRRRSHRLQPDDPRRVDVLHDYERGLSIIDIRMKHGLGAQTLKTWVTQAGLEPRTRGRTPHVLPPGEERGLDEEPISPELRAQIRESYRGGTSRRALRNQFSLTPAQLNIILRGIPKDTADQPLDLASDGVTRFVDPQTGRVIVWEIKFVQSEHIQAVTIDAALAEIRARLGADVEFIGVRRL